MNGSIDNIGMRKLRPRQISLPRAQIPGGYCFSPPTLRKLRKLSGGFLDSPNAKKSRGHLLLTQVKKKKKRKKIKFHRAMIWRLNASSRLRRFCLLSISLAIGVRDYMQLCSLDTSRMRRTRVYVPCVRAYAYFINFSGVHTRSELSRGVCPSVVRNTGEKSSRKTSPRDILSRKREREREGKKKESVERELALARGKYANAKRRRSHGATIRAAIPKHASYARERYTGCLGNRALSLRDGRVQGPEWQSLLAPTRDLFLRAVSESRVGFPRNKLHRGVPVN